MRVDKFGPCPNSMIVIVITNAFSPWENPRPSTSMPIAAEANCRSVHTDSFVRFCVPMLFSAAGCRLFTRRQSAKLLSYTTTNATLIIARSDCFVLLVYMIAISLVSPVWQCGYFATTIIYVMSIPPWSFGPDLHYRMPCSLISDLAF